MSNIERKAEVRLLGDLVKNPKRIFDTTAVLGDRDFSFRGTRVVFNCIKDLIENEGAVDKNYPVDQGILEQKIADKFRVDYDKRTDDFQSLLNDIYGQSSLSIRDFKSSVDFVLKNSITKRAVITLDRTKKELGDQATYLEVISHLESNVFDFTTNAIDGSDIVVLGEGYEEFLALREQQALKGNLHVGIDTGFPEVNKAVGGGLRDGTINVVAARSKMGKSWWALKIADNVVKQDVPVLYLDSELEDNYQSDRRCAQTARVPIHQLETAKWRLDEEFRRRVANAVLYFKRYPIYYVDIKGWSIDRQISVIRKFFAKHVGKRQDGKYNRGLVILDYLKLMRARDKGADKEWEALGYRMTLLHDLMGQYNNPMLALAQQNRDGLEREDEATISGSDRIIWLCDNFSILSPISEAELIIHHQEVDEGSVGEHSQVQVNVPNMKFKVVVCRHGPGTPGGYIAYYFDTKDRRLGHDQVCGHIEEGTRRITTGTSQLK